MGTGTGVKRVAEEEVLEIEDLSKKQFKPNEPKNTINQTALTFKKPAVTKSLGIKASMANLVKRKAPPTATTTTSDSANAGTATTSNIQATPPTATASASASTTPILTTNKPNALALLGGYNDSDSNDSD